MYVAYLMRKLIAVLTLALVVFASVDAYAQVEARPRRRGRKYKVRIDSSPQQAAIYLDDEKYGIVGYTPWDGRLQKGNWKVILKRDGYLTKTHTILVKRTRRKQTTFLPMTKKVVPAVLEVRADADRNSFDAEVWVDGQLQGKIPLVLKLKDGRHLVEVKKADHKTFSQWINVKEGERQTVNPVLQAIKKAKFGTILIEADVKGAEVLLDGNKQNGLTPMVIPKVMVGPHVIEVRKSPGIPWRQTINVELNKTTKISAELKASMQGPGGKVQVISNVDGAAVYLDGNRLGVVPLKINDVKAGEHVIEVRAKGFITREERIRVQAGQATVLKLDLQPVGKVAIVAIVTIVSRVPEADVFIDGESIGKAPKTKELSVGQHFIIVSKKGYQDFEQKINVTKNQKMTITAELKAVGGIRFLSNPTGATVLIDGKEIGQTPMVDEGIATGEHIVTIRQAGYFEYENAIKVEGGKLAVVNATLAMKQTGPSPAELVRQQKGLTSFGARTLPRGSSTIDFGVGYPYYFVGRITVGAGKIADKFGFDAGVNLRTFVTRTEIALAGRLTLFDQQPFSFGAFTVIGGGSSFFDESQRNSFAWDIGVAASLTGLGAVTVTGRAYVNMWSDRHCPELNTAGTGFVDNVDAHETCDEYLAGNMETITRVNDIVDGDPFGRDNGLRGIISLIVEVAIKQRWNLWFVFEGAPLQDERAAFTDLFSGTQLPEEDFGTYFRGGATFKF